MKIKETKRFIIINKKLNQFVLDTAIESKYQSMVSQIKEQKEYNNSFESFMEQLKQSVLSKPTKLIS